MKIPTSLTINAARRLFKKVRLCCGGVFWWQSELKVWAGTEMAIMSPVPLCHRHTMKVTDVAPVRSVRTGGGSSNTTNRFHAVGFSLSQITIVNMLMPYAECLCAVMSQCDAKAYLSLSVVVLGPYSAVGLRQLVCDDNDVLLHRWCRFSEVKHRMFFQDTWQ